MLDQLVLPVVGGLAVAALVGPTSVSKMHFYLLVKCVAPLVISAVADGGEALLTKFAPVRFLPCVGAQVDVQVPFLREHLPTTAFWAVEEVQSFVFRPLVELKPRKSGKRFVAHRPPAPVALGL